MPQINQLAEAAYSQFFWLLVVLALIYFGIGRFMVPKIQSTVDLRDRRIADDLAAAQAARGQADETEATYRTRMDESRADALKLAQAAKVEGAKVNEERLRAANQDMTSRLESAETRIRASRDAALTEIESFAADAAREMVERLAGLSVGSDEAAAAVKAAMAHG